MKKSLFGVCFFFFCSDCAMQIIVLHDLGPCKQLTGCELDAQFEWQPLAIFAYFSFFCVEPSFQLSISPFVFSRIRRCSPSPGSMQLDTAGSWTRTRVCSNSGPSTQVNTHTNTADNNTENYYFFGWKKYKQNALCREIRRRSDLRPKDMESQLPLCDELAAWHRGGERQERQQRPPSRARLQDAACRPEIKRWDSWQEASKQY